MSGMWVLLLTTDLIKTEVLKWVEVTTAVRSPKRLAKTSVQAFGIGRAR